MKDDLENLFAFNVWANRHVFDAVRRLTREAYTHELGGSFPSIRATLVHLAGATFNWAERLDGREATHLLTEKELAELADAERVLRAADERIVALLPTFGPERLAAPFTWRNVERHERTAPLWAVLRHVVNHASYHRGQIASMLRRLGERPSATDLVRWAIEQHAAETRG